MYSVVIALADKGHQQHIPEVFVVQTSQQTKLKFYVCSILYYVFDILTAIVRSAVCYFILLLSPSVDYYLLAMCSSITFFPVEEFEPLLLLLYGRPLCLHNRFEHISVTYGSLYFSAFELYLI
jgi:hypothetical protein